MKIAMMTFHDTANFGSLLQTYGLYQAMREIHVPCEILDYQCEAIRSKEVPTRRPESWAPRKIARYFLLDRVKRKKYRTMKSEAEKLFVCSQPYARDTVVQAQKKYDAFLVGGDILWGLDNTGGDTAYFLDFVQDPAKKYAFGTSVGNGWNEEEKTRVRPLLKDFCKIAVREEEAASWVEELTGARPPVVCDPTMLLETRVWRELAEKSRWTNRLKKKPYVLTYFDTKDGRMQREARTYAKAHGLLLYSINYAIPKWHTKNIRPLRVEDFLALLYNASAVFSASYHGMMFSIYFEKPLYYYSDRRSSRFNTVASHLGLLKQRREPNTPFVEHAIDYAAVNRKVARWREESLGILKSYWEESNEQDL